MLRCICVLLVAQLALGCSTLRPVDPSEFQRQLRMSDEPIALRAQDGSTVRLDPNTEVRFHLHGGSVTRWVRGGDLWHSSIGLSFGEHGGVFLLRWDEIAGAEVRNLSSGKTALAIAVSAVIVGVVVVAVLGSLKGGGGSGSFGSLGGGIGGGGRRKRGKGHHAPVTRRQILPRGQGGAHVHVPLITLAATTHHHQACGSCPYGSAAYSSDEMLSDAPPLELPTVADGSPALAMVGDGGAIGPAEEIRATPLFGPLARRRFSVQLVTSASVGTEFVRLDRYSGSLYLGLRLRDALEIGGGVRHMLAPLPPSAGEALRSSVVGFGRIGAHLGLGVRKRAAIAMSLDAGSGYNSLVQLKFNVGLRLRPTERMSIGLFPFTPTFNYYDEASAFRGALRWTFPTTIEVGFSY